MIGAQVISTPQPSHHSAFSAGLIVATSSRLRVPPLLLRGPDAVSADFPVEGPPVDSQDRRCSDLVPPCALQDLLDVYPLQILQRGLFGQGAFHRTRATGEVRGEIARQDRGTSPQRHGPFNDVLQLADV